VVLRRSLALFVVTVVMMAVSPGWAKAWGSENGCGASNAEFGKPPRLRSEHSAIAGSKTIPCFRTNPKAPFWLDAPVESGCWRTTSLIRRTGAYRLFVRVECVG
jgi:hypothetical protein